MRKHYVKLIGLTIFVLSAFAIFEMCIGQDLSVQVHTEQATVLHKLLKKISVDYYAKLYQKGQKLQQQNHTNEAIRYFEKSAEGNNTDALHALATYYFKNNNSLAEQYARRGAVLGDDDCQLRLGRILCELGRNEEGLSWLLKSAEQGHDQAQYLVGRMYENGTGTNKDLDKAIYWYRNSAKNKMNLTTRRAKSALSRLGVHVYGDDNYMELVAKIQIEQHLSPSALYYRGRFWKYSEETPENFAYLIASAEKGYLQAQTDLGNAFSSVEAKYLGIYDEAKSKEWHSKAFDGLMKQAEAGDANAMQELGDYYNCGNSLIKKDIALAEKYYRMGAELGNDGCQLSLGQILRKKGEMREALEWFEKSGMQDQGWSAYLAGEMYEKGEGTLKNLDKAIEWYRKSAKTTNAYAMYAKDALRRLGQPVPDE